MRRWCHLRRSHDGYITDVDEFDVGWVTDINANSNNVNENAAIGTLLGIPDRYHCSNHRVCERFGRYQQYN